MGNNKKQLTFSLKMNIISSKLIFGFSKGSSLNVLSTFAVIYNLVAHAIFGYQTFDHD